jgi:hypothetical protein
MAEEVAMLVAGLVMTTGGPMGLNVVKVLSIPGTAGPALFMAMMRKWYVLLGVKLLISAATFWNVSPLLPRCVVMCV